MQEIKIRFRDQPRAGGRNVGFCLNAPAGPSLIHRAPKGRSCGPPNLGEPVDDDEAPGSTNGAPHAPDADARYSEVVRWRELQQGQAVPSTRAMRRALQEAGIPLGNTRLHAYLKRLRALDLAQIPPRTP